MPVASDSGMPQQTIQGGQFQSYSDWLAQHPQYQTNPQQAQMLYAQQVQKPAQQMAQAQQQNQQRQDYMLPGYQQRNQQYQQSANQAMQNQAPQLGPAAQSNAFGAQTNGLVDYLSKAAQGQGPSLAQMQYQGASDQAMRNQLAMAASARPGNAAGAARAAAQNLSGIQGGLANGLAQAGIQERMGAANALTGALGMANQNAQYNAGAQNQFGLAQANLTQQQTGQNQDFYSRMQQLALQNAIAQQQGGEAYQQNQTQRYQIDQSTPQWYDKLLSMGSSVLPVVAGMM